MTVSFDTNVLVCATSSKPEQKSSRARDVIARGMRNGSSILLLQTLTEFSSVATRKAGISVDRVLAMIRIWQSVMAVESAQPNDLFDALHAVKSRKLSFWDAMIWATARRVGLRHVLTEDFQDRFELEGVLFVNPFKPSNDRLIDEILPVVRGA